MHLIIAPIVFVALAAIIVWVADWTTVGERRATAVDILPTAGLPLSAKLHGSAAARIVAWALATAIVILSLVHPALRPETSVPHSLEHIIIFAATGFAFGLGYTRRHDLLAILLVLFSICVEIAQLFVAGRHARVSDLIFDAVAACIGLATASLLRPARVQN